MTDVVRALLAQRQHTHEWKATTAKVLTGITGDLTRITQTLDNTSHGDENSTKIISDATNELAHVIDRTRRLAEQCAPEAIPTNADI